jgi:hypothetical protein
VRVGKHGPWGIPLDVTDGEKGMWTYYFDELLLAWCWWGGFGPLLDTFFCCSRTD